ncbi:Wzz/FepE/Etk N-terminal domain-containing protein [Aliivibrio salmonicida]|uniref:O-antigen length determinant protein n=1 Tax=Aliivibrio salmonicida (strain LFI1238) TaxID=316275 RepID=B6EPI3_ALISL|nr:Wzz/FepE/Etk N-terminal domain-containing protein [Aliivibrio salmonicida]CAQ77963.1 O-antigen length determinant protein [Aliivibrio salmonicida LFI1238]
MNEKQQLPHSQHLAFPPAMPADDEIDLRELFGALWKGKWIIIATTFIFAVGGVLFALSQPNTYKAEVVLAPAGESGGGLAVMAGELGGLASLAGINIGGGGTDSKGMSLAVLQSRQFINAFITKHDLVVPLFAGTEWNKQSGELIIDPEVYNTETKEWVREVKPDESPVPTDWQAHKAFKGFLSTADAKDTGLVTLSVTHISPIIAQQWVEWLVADLNLWMKDKSLTETKRNIGYLEQQLQKTDISDMRSVFYQLIEDQTKNLMLAEVEAEFAFKTIDPAVIPEEKAGPKRALICVLSVLLGGMLGVAVVLVRFAFRKEELETRN